APARHNACRPSALAAEKTIGTEPAEDEVGIGDGGLDTAEPIADRAGLGARAFRPNMQRAHFGARDRAAAGADLLHVDHRDLHRQPSGIGADERAAGHQHVAAVDDAGLAVVPPMSKAIAFLSPMRSHSALVPMTPAAGPDSSMRMQALCASSTPNRPPVDCTIRKSPSKPATAR